MNHNDVDGQVWKRPKYLIVGRVRVGGQVVELVWTRSWRGVGGSVWRAVWGRGWQWHGDDELRPSS